MAGMLQNDMSDLIDRQNTIIKEQSDIINQLLLLLMEHMTVEEVDNLPQVKRINEIAKLRGEINEP